MPYRAIKTLRQADTVCAEDTRVTGKLLAALGIEGKRLERLDENILSARTASIIERVKQGEVIVYCSDAGMPGVSDPGLRLVNEARAADIAVEVLPGPSAVVTAYVASGTTASQFYFGGFFPRKKAARRHALAQLKDLPAALVFYESPNRLVAALRAIAEECPLREIAVCRELTKLHEEIVRGSASRIADEFARRASIKGEIVIVIDPPSESELDTQKADVAHDALTRARALRESGMSPKSIAQALMKEFDIPRNEAYSIALDA